MTIRVINSRLDMSENGPEPHETVIDITRKRSKLGNPFVLSNQYSKEEREGNLTRFKYFFDKDIVNKGPLYEQMQLLLSRLKLGEHLCLQCVCKPLPCHGDIYVDYLNKQLQSKD